MNTIIEQFNATHKANMETLVGMTANALTDLEKMMSLNMIIAKSILNESANHAQVMLDIASAKENVSAPGFWVQPMLEQSSLYAKQMQVLLQGGAEQYAKIVDSKTTQVQESAAKAMQGITKNAPSGSETTVAAYQNAMSAGHEVMQVMQAHAKKAVGTVKANLITATTQVNDVVKKVRKSAKKAG